MDSTAAKQQPEPKPITQTWRGSINVEAAIWLFKEDHVSPLRDAFRAMLPARHDSRLKALLKLKKLGVQNPRKSVSAEAKKRKASKTRNKKMPLYVPPYLKEALQGKQSPAYAMALHNLTHDRLEFYKKVIDVVDELILFAPGLTEVMRQAVKAANAQTKTMTAETLYSPAFRELNEKLRLRLLGVHANELGLSDYDIAFLEDIFTQCPMIGGRSAKQTGPRRRLTARVKPHGL